MIRQIFIVLRSNLSDLSQVPPRTSWKIMVLNMVANVNVGDIPPPYVVITLLSLDEFVMFSDDMNGCGVGPDRAESCDEGEE